MWESAYCCVKCDGWLSWRSVMGSHGVCPLCGNSSESTVIDTYKRSYYKKIINPWYKFWLKHYEIVWGEKPSRKR